MAIGHKTGGRDFTPEAPGPGRPPGALNKVPPTVKASVRAVFQDIVADEPTLIRDAILKGLHAPPPKSFPYLQLAAAYVDGKPADKLQVRNYDRLTDDELAMLEHLLARATSEDDEDR
jgi:hypothetical protein